MRKFLTGLTAAFLILSWNVSGQAQTPSHPTYKHVILISIDGLRPDAITQLGPDQAPSFYEILKTGATTLNARTDYDYTVTLPNHLCMLTGLGVTGVDGHQYTGNTMDEKTVHDVRGKYVPSIFDVVHESTLRSAFFASKLKFMVYIQSYGAKGFDLKDSVLYNGGVLIDGYAITDQNYEAIMASFLRELESGNSNFLFLHLGGPDKAGHRNGWNVTNGSAYLNEVQKTDGFIGQILTTIRSHENLAKTTALIITADHGGNGPSHGEVKDPHNYTIPFLVWSNEGIAKGADLYSLNPASRKDPRQERVPYNAADQPIRNGDAANLALSLLGLPPIPASTINNKQDLNVF
jgi:predicted AlkP superfamily pyrophosphatase or phosphodiesterase